MAGSPPKPQQNTVYCVNHPQVATVLCCNQCGEPVCFECVTHMAVGYRCKRCIRAQQQVYFNGLPQDNVFAYAFAFALAIIALPLVALLLSALRELGLLTAWVVGISAGKALTKVVQKVIARRRNRYLRWWVIGGLTCGALSAAIIMCLRGAFALLTEASLWVFVLLALVTVRHELP